MSPTTNSPRSVLLDTLKHLLHPVVRLCVRNSIKLNEAIEVLKVAFVQAAEEELKKAGEHTSASRMSIMTGVHRKDVTRISKTEGAFKPYDDTIGKVMVQWQHDKRFTTKAGKARVLATEGRESEFAALVDSVNGGDLSAYAVLFEMERMGIVERSHGQAKLLWESFSPDPSVQDGLAMLAGDTADLFAAVEENIFARQDVPNLHLKTVFTNIVSSKIGDVRRWLLEEGSAFHRRVRSYVSQFDTDLNPALKGKEAGKRMALGTFGFVESEKSTDKGKEEK